VDTSRTYGQDIVAGVRRYVAEHGPWSIYLEPRDLLSSYPAWLEDWPGDGILARTGNAEMLQRLKATGLSAAAVSKDSPLIWMAHWISSASASCAFPKR
jgi:LacI family transcriptional regulator